MSAAAAGGAVGRLTEPLRLAAAASRRPLAHVSRSPVRWQHAGYGRSGPTISRVRPPVNVGFVIVPQQRAFVVERLGKFHATLDPGFHLLIPFLDRIAYVHSLKEEAVLVANQTAITRDNVVLQIDGVLYLRIRDPYLASYGVSDPIYALTQLVSSAAPRHDGGKRERLCSSLPAACYERASLRRRCPPRFRCRRPRRRCGRNWARSRWTRRSRSGRA